MKVKKRSGEFVEFEIGRLRGSLAKSGASPIQVDEALAVIQPRLYEGMRTQDIYRLAFRELKRKADSFAARYSLKRALCDLGPAGFYFEHWVGRLFRYEGYQTITGQKLDGHAVSHEIDVVAQRDDKLLLMECKFRNATDARISVTTPMYFLSRIKDLSGIPFDFFGRKLNLAEGWLVSNVYWTRDSISFAERYGIHLLGWDYPSESSIKRRVDSAGLYPITCLTTLSKAHKAILLTNGCILVKDIVNNQQVLAALNLPASKKQKVVNEAAALINISQENN